MGIQVVSVIDFDIVERHNLDRLLHAGRQDYLKKRLKVDVLAKALKKSATAKNFVVNAIPFSITEERGFREALDCDVLFSCVDRPWGRYVLNLIAYAHLIRAVDRRSLPKSLRHATRRFTCSATFPRSRDVTSLWCLIARPNHWCLKMCGLARTAAKDYWARWECWTGAEAAGK